MNLKSKRKLLILTVNALALIVLLVIRDSQVENFLQQTSNKAEYNEVMLKATLMLHNQSTYTWIAGIALGLLLLNMFSYRQWIQSKKWILEPIIILIISYGLAFSLYTLRIFEIRDQLIEEKRVKETRSTPPKDNAVISPSEDDEWIDADDLDSLRTHGMPE